jgi:hypothetical protein
LNYTSEYIKYIFLKIRSSLLLLSRPPCRSKENRWQK